MEENEIQKAINDGILKGDIDISGLTKAGELLLSISEKGESQVVNEIMGGQDVANVIGGLIHILKTRGNFLGHKLNEADDGIVMWSNLLTLVMVIKHCKTWESLVVSCEKLLVDESKWFEHHPHSDFWDIRVEKNE